MILMGWREHLRNEEYSINTQTDVFVMKMCTVLPSTPACAAPTAAACSLIEPHGLPSALGECICLWCRQPPYHPAQRDSGYWLCTRSYNDQSGGCRKLSALLIHLCHLQSKSMSQPWISFCVFPSHWLRSLLLSPSPRAAPGFCSRQQVTCSRQQHSHSAFLLPGVSAPQHISNPASELSGDMFGLTASPWLSVDLSPFFWMFKYFSWESTPWHLSALFFSQPVLAWFRTITPFQ